MKITFNEFIKENFEDDFEYNFEDEVTKNFGRSFGNDADWSGTVWSVLTNDDINGFFIYYGDDDEIELLYRKFDPEEEKYDNTTIFTATDRETFDELIKIAKDKDKLKMIQKINKYNV